MSIIGQSALHSISREEQCIVISNVLGIVTRTGQQGRQRAQLVLVELG